MTGAVLQIARPGGHRDPAYLAGLIEQRSVTTAHFVPSMLRVFVDQFGVSRCRGLKRVISSGEALSADLQRRFFETLGSELHNLYGPTEASVDVTYWACRREPSARSVPIGRPIANTRIHILNEDLEPAPIGVDGMIHIGGVGLARGYANGPAQTAEK